jgi:ABC-type Zn uptake system ZnuABC Zn-binding protein ZnuA
VLGILKHIAWLCALLPVLTLGCREGDAAENGPEIAVTNSYLQCVVRDLWGEDLGVLCLASPGMCPGHFDISPGQVRQLRNCRLLLRFDFQQGVEDRLARLREGGLDVQSVAPAGGLCVPDTYVAVCGQVCRALSQAYPQRAGQFADRLKAVEQRMTVLGEELQNALIDSGAGAAEVLASNHQAQFAQWLGLEPIATFVGSDTETVANIDHCLKRTADREVRFVIANRQEGVALAQALADRCRARAVVFSNFPEACEQGAGFDRLLRENVRSLCEAATE